MENNRTQPEQPLNIQRILPTVLRTTLKRYIFLPIFIDSGICQHGALHVMPPAHYSHID